MSDLIYNAGFVFLDVPPFVYIMPVGAIWQLFAYLHAKATVDADDAPDNEEISVADLRTRFLLVPQMGWERNLSAIQNLLFDESINKFTIKSIFAAF